MIQVFEALSHELSTHAQEAPAQDHKRWAREIVAAWNANQYQWQHGYHLACEALGITPTPRPPVHQPERRAYIEDPSFIDSGNHIPECESPANRFTHPYQQQDF